jgi:uncharacterized protein with HEPN domain
MNELANKIQELEQELNNMIQMRDQLAKQHTEVNVRIHQIVGAIDALRQVVAAMAAPKEEPKLEDVPKTESKSKKKN